MWGTANSIHGILTFVTLSIPFPQRVNTSSHTRPSQLVHYSTVTLQFYPVIARNTDKIHTLEHQIYCLSVSHNPVRHVNIQVVQIGQLPLRRSEKHAWYVHWGGGGGCHFASVIRQFLMPFSFQTMRGGGWGWEGGDGFRRLFLSYRFDIFNFSFCPILCQVYYIYNLYIKTWSKNVILIQFLLVCVLLDAAPPPPHWNFVETIWILFFFVFGKFYILSRGGRNSLFQYGNTGFVASRKCDR